jgi:hypothetical protein
MVSLLSTVQGLPDAQRVEVERALVPYARDAAAGALAGDIAHDAGNALFGLVGLIGLIRAGEPVSARGLDVLLGAGRDLDDALRPLLHFARGADDDGARADLVETARQALSLYRHGERKQLAVDVQLPDEPLRVECPPSATLQAVVHLLLAAHPVARLAVDDDGVSVSPARDASLDELVAARIAADAGGSVTRTGDAFVLRLPAARSSRPTASREARPGGGA